MRNLGVAAITVLFSAAAFFFFFFSEEASKNLFTCSAADTFSENLEDAKEHLAALNLKFPLGAGGDPKQSSRRVINELMDTNITPNEC